jgi:predicted molibdopterin-dependent oxidoreductase YjgC
MSSEKKEEKVDIKSLVSIIPPASAMRQERKQVKEKRVKLRRRIDLDKGFVTLSSRLASELNVKEEVEISVKGRRGRFKILIQDNVPENEVWASAEDMKEIGFEDNSVVTVRGIK